MPPPSNNKANLHTKQIEVLTNEGLLFQTNALLGLPSQLSLRITDYFTAAFDVLDGRGAFPARLGFLMPKMEGSSIGYNPDRNGFPMNYSDLRKARIDIEIVGLPEPEIVRNGFGKTPSLEELAQRDSIGDIQLAKVVTAIKYFDVRENATDWGILLPTPRGFSGYRSESSPWFERQQLIGRAHTLGSAERFSNFPALEKHEAEATWYGSIASFPVKPGNEILRWVFVNDPAQLSVRNWLAYSILDANGIYAGAREIDQVDVMSNDFLRRLIPPWAPTLTSIEFQANPKFSRYNLLLTPVPISLWSGVSDYSEEWTITEQFYSEHEIPAWCLYADKDSRPFRETFYIKHALEPCDHTLWKVLIFSSIKPQDLVRVLARVKNVPDEQMPTAEEIDRSVKPAFDEFRKEVEISEQPSLVK